MAVATLQRLLTRLKQDASLTPATAVAQARSRCSRDGGCQSDGGRTERRIQMRRCPRTARTLLQTSPATWTTTSPADLVPQIRFEQFGPSPWQDLWLRGSSERSPP